MNSLPNLIVRLSHDPFNFSLNFDVAEEYLRNNQTASAVSFYLRTVEYGPDKSEKGYTALLRMGLCFDDQQGREYSVSNCLLQAIAYDDTRPEAYWLLSKHHERAQQWQESYTYAVLGLGWLTEHSPLPANLGFDVTASLQFQKGVAAWWIGRKEESLQILRDLSNQDLSPMYREAVNYNLEKLGAL